MKIMKTVSGDEIDKQVDAIWDEVNVIVDRHGGSCDDVGPIGEDHTPFEFLLTEAA